MRTQADVFLFLPFFFFRFLFFLFPFSSTSGGRWEREPGMNPIESLETLPDLVRPDLTLPRPGLAGLSLVGLVSIDSCSGGGHGADGGAAGGRLSDRLLRNESSGRRNHRELLR